MPQDRAEVGEAQGGSDAAEVEYYGGVVGRGIRRRQRIGREKCADPFWGYHAGDCRIERQREQAGAKDSGEDGGEESCRREWEEFEWQGQIGDACGEKRSALFEESAEDRSHAAREEEIVMADSQSAVADKSKVNGAAAGSGPVTFLEAIKQAL